MLRKRTLGNKKKSTYTVYSNCNGGSVYFNNNLVGIKSRYTKIGVLICHFKQRRKKQNF